MEYLVKPYDIGMAPSVQAAMTHNHSCIETGQKLPHAYIATSEIQWRANFFVGFAGNWGWDAALEKQERLDERRREVSDSKPERKVKKGKSGRTIVIYNVDFKDDRLGQYFLKPQEATRSMQVMLDTWKNTSYPTTQTSMLRN